MICRCKQKQGQHKTQVKKAGGWGAEAELSIPSSSVLCQVLCWGHAWALVCRGSSMTCEGASPAQPVNMFVCFWYPNELWHLCLALHSAEKASGSWRLDMLSLSHCCFTFWAPEPFLWRWDEITIISTILSSNKGVTSIRELCENNNNFHLCNYNIKGHIKTFCISDFVMSNYFFVVSQYILFWLVAVLFLITNYIMLHTLHSY